MACTAQNFTIWVGDDNTITTVVRDVNNATVDLSDLVDAQWTFKAYPLTAIPIFEKILGSGIVVTNPAGGAISVTIDASDTSDLMPGEYYHELRIIDVANLTSTVAIGTITLKTSDPF